MEYNLRDEPPGISNTFYMEQVLRWSGLLIEPNRQIYINQLASRNKKTSITPTCLSSYPYPMRRQVTNRTSTQS